jgi:hypothetical protein
MPSASEEYQMVKVLQQRFGVASFKRETLALSTPNLPLYRILVKPGI